MIDMSNPKCSKCGIEKKVGIAMMYLGTEFYCGTCGEKLIKKINEHQRKWLQEISNEDN